MLAYSYMSTAGTFSTHKQRKLCSHIISVRARIKPSKCSLTIKKNRKIGFQKSHKVFPILYLLQTNSSVGSNLSKKSTPNFVVICKGYDGLPDTCMGRPCGFFGTQFSFFSLSSNYTLDGLT